MAPASRGAVGEIPPLLCLSSNPDPVNPGGDSAQLGSLTGAVSS